MNLIYDYEWVCNITAQPFIPYTLFYTSYFI